MQSIQWEKCAQPASELLAESMEKKIEGFIIFLDSDNPQSSIDTAFESSRDLRYEYNQEYTALLPRKEKIKAEREFMEVTTSGMLTLMRSQQLINHMEDKPFIKTIEEFNSSFEAILVDEENYNYEIAEAADTKFVITVSAKQRGLKSYAMGIQATGSDFEAIVCVSDEPSKKIEAPELLGLEWSCAEKSSELSP
ncbi:MAG: type IV pilin-like G/H family protein [Cyanobacteria bacterium J06627_28]